MSTRIFLSRLAGLVGVIIVFMAGAKPAQAAYYRHNYWLWRHRRHIRRRW